MRAAYVPGQHLASVALSRDGSRIYALATDHRVTALASVTGSVLGSAATQSSAWSIEE